jgi:hypothetical protein
VPDDVAEAGAGPVVPGVPQLQQEGVGAGQRVQPLVVRGVLQGLRLVQETVRGSLLWNRKGGGVHALWMNME